jgi:hypothetical protein
MVRMTYLMVLACVEVFCQDLCGSWIPTTRRRRSCREVRGWEAAECARVRREEEDALDMAPGGGVDREKELCG